MSYYFVGIGGIGMSALASYFHRKGYAVAGYDKTPSEITEKLSGDGISVCFDESETAIPPRFRQPASTTVIYTPAVPGNHDQITWFRAHGFVIMKRSEMLASMASTMKCLAVAGTHGKTSISTLTAWVLNQKPSVCNAFLGGLSVNFGSNLVLHPESNMVVVEADEYDRSFLKLFPDIALVSYIDTDHLDIYGSADYMQQAYNEFIFQVKSDGCVIIKHDISEKLLSKHSTRYTYSYNDSSASFAAANIRIKESSTHFDLQSPFGIISNLEIAYAGKHHIENAVAASAIALCSGAKPETIREGLRTFRGVKRRFEYILNTPKIVYIDDYAHHPREIEATLEATRSLFPHKKITAIFQPHLYSRTRDFADEFANILSQFDEVILLPVYPARELPIPGVESEMIYDRITLAKKHICKKSEIEDYIVKNIETDILISMGAGDIDRHIQTIKTILMR